MPALQASTRFFMPEVSVVLYAATIADIQNVTRAELDAATDLSGEIAELNGFLPTSNFLDTPDLKHRFVSKIGGRISIADSSITFWASQDGDDIRQLQHRNDRAFLLFLDGGDVPGQPMDVYPIQVASVGKQRTTSEQGAQVVITYAITAVPAEDVEIPAAA